MTEFDKADAMMAIVIANLLDQFRDGKGTSLEVGIAIISAIKAIAETTNHPTMS